MTRQELIKEMISGYERRKWQLEIEISNYEHHLATQGRSAFSPLFRDAITTNRKQLDMAIVLLELLTVEQKRLDSTVNLTDETTN